GQRPAALFAGRNPAQGRRTGRGRRTSGAGRETGSAILRRLEALRPGIGRQRRQPGRGRCLRPGHCRGRSARRQPGHEGNACLPQTRRQATGPGFLMAVYTRIDAADLDTLLADYAIGDLENYQAIDAGITNTNYFVDTTLGHWVLTLFEHMDADALPFFMTVMDHLAAHGVPGAHPVARNDGGFLSRVQGRPAALVYRLRGASVTQPSAAQCAALGGVVAAMHQAAQTL